MKEKIKNHLPLLVIILIASIICFKNYTPGTILSGWDTLHPEFNFGLTIKREILGVFRSYQGLGAVDAHSDIADLPRIVLLAILDVFLPMEFLRYSYIFLNLIIGPIGMYCFLKRVVFSKTPNDSTIPSFLGALFYLLNLGTMQQFIVPFEMFTTQYASLPWLFLFATEYFNTKTHQKKTLVLFTITTLFSAPMAYAATLWYVYFIAFILYLGSLSLLKIHLGGVMASPLSADQPATSEVVLRRSQTRLGRLTSRLRHTSEVNPISLAKKAFTLILLTLLLNSFWILPNLYYILNHSQEVAQANINKLFSPQAFLYNKEFGNIKDISLLKTFLFDWNVYSGNNHFVQLLSPWITHLKQPFVQPSGFLFAGIAFLGIIYCIFNPFDKLRVNAEQCRSIKRNKILIALLPLLFLCLFFLFNDNFPTSYFYGFIADKIPFFKEAFRFPQDKVLGIFTFLFAIYFGAGQLLITKLITAMKNQGGVAPEEGLPTARTRSARSQVPYGTWRSETSGALAGGNWRQDPDATKLRYAQVTIFVMLLFYFMLPAFKGHFINPYMRIKIPEVYFEMFKWFDKEAQDGRIANLPIHSLWGWEYYNWYKNKTPSFQGAGFLWFGIKQPILARDFDRWSPYNEKYYREMSYAIYSQNPEALKLALEKYNIKYVLFDKSIIAPQNPYKVLLHKETQALLDKQDYIEKAKEFGNNLIVYKVKPKPSLTWSKTPYEEHYPFRNLIDNQNKVLPNIIKLTQEGVVIKLPKNVGNFSLPSYLDTEELVPSDLVVEKNLNRITIAFYPRLPIVNTKKSPDPITLKAPIPQNENIILSINKKDNFILETLPSNTPLSLGTVFLKTKENNTITLYPSTPNEKITPDLSTIKYYIEPCQDIADQRGYRTVPSFGVEKAQGNSFNIFAKNVALCMTIPLSEIISKDLNYSEVLLSVAFNYKSNLPLKFCLAKLINGTCQNYRYNSLLPYFGLENKDIQRLGVQFQLDTTNSDKLVKASYSNLSLNLTYPFFLATISKDTLKKSLETISETLSKPTPLILPYSGNKELSSDITKLPRTSGYCPNSPISNPPLIKKQILENNRKRFIRYTSIDGLSCDHFSYQNLSQNEAYLVAITSRNVKGLPSTLCITNAVSRHCDIYTTLSSYKDFNTDIFLLPAQIKDENGFDINIGNLGINRSPSINDLKSIEIIPFPYMWLSQIRTMKQFNNETMSHLLILPQSFEKGWKAYEVESSKLKIENWLKTLLPFVFGKEIKNHVLVNNWSNGWILQNSQLSTLNSQLIIVFLPQYLEYIGFLLLLGTVALLIFAYRSTPEKI